MAQTDVIEGIIGAFGKYQLFLCAVIFIAKIPIAQHQMAIIFLAPKMTYSCKDSNNIITINSCPCKNPTYDTSIFTSTITTEWHLICDRKWMGSFSQTLFQSGTLVGSLFFGMASDRYGRKIPLLGAVALQVSMGVAAAYMYNYWLFAFLRFLIGFSVGGTMVITFVIIMEFIGTKYREIVSALYQLPFNLGHLTLPIYSYFIRDFRSFQLAISIPTAVMLSYFVLVPETPRWLIAVNKTNEAVKILTRVAKINHLPTENIQSDIDIYQETLQKNQLRKGNISDLFRTSNLRKNILCMAFDWLTCSYCFYGLSQYIGHLSGNVFINVAASACFTLIGCLLSIVLLKTLGRKTIVIASNYICCGSLILLIFLPTGIISVMLAIIGVVFSFIVFVVVYLYCSELFPTVVRNAAIGFSSMMARVGSMIAPFIIDTGEFFEWMPPFLFAILPFLAGTFTFLLPETKGCELMTTLAQGENFGKKGVTINTENK